MDNLLIPHMDRIMAAIPAMDKANQVGLVY